MARFNVCPTHIGLLEDGAGVAGIGLTTTAVVPAGPVHPVTVAVTEYVPAPAAVMPVMDGFWEEEVNPFGPVHEYVAPAMFDAVRFSVDPSHTGELLPAVGAAGVGFTTTLTVPAKLVQPFTVTVRE